MSEARKWHAWSVWKTQVLLGAYLPAFTTACSGVAHRTFIDCFAGDPDAVDMQGEPFEGSPRVALKTTPPFTHAVFFELEETAIALDAALRAEFPGRAFHVEPGDCNLHIDAGLAWIRNQGTAYTGPQLGPILALLDPDSMELSWSTIETIANWSGQSSPSDYKRKREIELLVLFPTGPLRRTLPSDPTKEEASESAKMEADRLFGDDRWREIYEAQRSGAIKGEDAWMHYVELYRLGLHGLGYSYTSVIEVRNTQRVVLYHLVFATANNTGKKVMKDVQNKARRILPAMVEEERRARKVSGPTLFEEDDADLDRYAADPSKWAFFTDDPPQAFDPSRYVHHAVAEPGTLF